VNLQIFNNEEFGEIRTVVKNGEPLFCLTDVCRALELTNPQNVKKRLNEKGICTIDTLTNGGVQSLLYINEPNLYKTIFQSRKDSVSKIPRTHVKPSILSPFYRTQFGVSCSMRHSTGTLK
jgi:anti-repressor protein